MTTVICPMASRAPRPPARQHGHIAARDEQAVEALREELKPLMRIALKPFGVVIDEQNKGNELVSDNKYEVPALTRAKRILDLLCNLEADMPEIIKRLGLPKSTVYNLLRTLEDMRFIRRLPGSQKYALGFRLYELGTLAVSRMSIRDQALPFLQELVRKEKVTCHLGTLDGIDAVYLLKADPKDSALINSWKGKRLSLNRSAMGKILLAWLPPEQQLELVDSLEFYPATINTITDKDDFRNHLADKTILLKNRLSGPTKWTHFYLLLDCGAFVGRRFQINVFHQR